MRTTGKRRDKPPSYLHHEFAATLAMMFYSFVGFSNILRISYLSVGLILKSVFGAVFRL